MYKWILVFTLLVSSAYAGEPSGWGNYPPEIHAWFPTVMQPGGRYVSCCGEGDAFVGKAIGSDGFGGISIQVDDGKGIIADGTVVMAPRDKIQVNYGNPLGIIIVFISMSDHRTVLCLVPPTEG